MSDEIARIGGPPARTGPRTYVRDDGFQIVQGVTAVTIKVEAGRHVSITTVTGPEMEAAMIANWEDAVLNNLDRERIRIGSLQFGVRGARSITSGSIFTFSTAESDW